MNKVPKALLELTAQLTYAEKLRKFKLVRDREPESDEEMEEFILEVARDLYNAECEKWPENNMEFE